MNDRTKTPTELLAQAVRLILVIDAMPPENNPETIELCTASRQQLIDALAANGETWMPPTQPETGWSQTPSGAMMPNGYDDPTDLEIEDAHAINEDETFGEGPKSSHVRDLRTGDVVRIEGERGNGDAYALTLSLLGTARPLRDGRLYQIMGSSDGGTLLAMEQFFDDDTDPEFCAVRVCTFVDQSRMGLTTKRRTLLCEGVVTRINGDRVEDISFLPELTRINIKRLSTGYYHIRGDGPCNWTQPKEWPCDEEQIRACAHPEAGEDFLQSVIRISSAR